MDGGAWWAAVHGVAKSRIRLSDFTFTFHFHTLEREMATHSNVLAWRIPGTGEPGGCRLWGRTELDMTEATCSSSSSNAGDPGFDPWVGKIPWRRKWQPTPVHLPGKSHGRRSLVGCSPWGHEESDTTEQLHFHFSLSCTGEGNGNPLRCSCLKNPRDGGAWWAAVYRVAQSRTRLKRLSR